MDIIRNNIVNIIFNNDKKLINRFNKKISVPCSYLQNFLYINNEKYKIIKEEKIYNSNTLTKLKNQQTISIKSIYENVKKIIKGNTKDINNNNYNIINPVLIILCYKLLEKDNFTFIKTINDNIEIRSTNNISSKIVTSLKLFIKLFFNNNFIELLPKIRKHMILNFIINKEISEIPYNYIDIYINMGNREKLLINFDNENNIDKDSITLAITNNMLYHYNVENTLLSNFIKILYDNIARKCYNNNNMKAIAFYITNNGISLEYALLFTNLYTKEIKLKDFISMLESCNLSKVKFNKLLKNAITNGDIDNININENSIITTNFITKFLNYPRKCEWNESPLIKEYFNIFTEKYFEFIKDYMKNNNIKNIFLMKAIYHFKHFNSFHKMCKISILKYIEWIIKNKKTNLKFHPTIPILIYSEDCKIIKNKLLENIYGHENLYEELLNSKNFNNSIYLDLKYRIDMTDTKEYILNYRLITEEELQQILEL